MMNTDKIKGVLSFCRACRDAGVTMERGLTLWLVGAGAGLATSAGLARDLEICRMAACERLLELMEAGLVQRKRGLADARKVFYELTREGVEKAEKLTIDH